MENHIPKIVAFLCTWCSYAGADLAGTGRNQYPPNIRVIRVPCSGRINPIYIIKALLEGADGVMVSGCHPGDCHYLVGNYHARRRFTVLKKLLTTAGFEPDRVQFTWVSASEGARFADVVTEVTAKVTVLGSSLMEIIRQRDGSSVICQGDGSSVIPEMQVEGSAASLENQEKSSARVEQGDDSSAFLHKNGNFSLQQKELISLCKNLLEENTVNTVIGFQKGGELGLSLPCFIDSPMDAGKLVWNNRCVPNLSGYLSERIGRTAIVAKPCDARAVVSLIKENQLKRNDIYIVGLACDGMVNSEGKPLPACLECKVRIPPVYEVLVGDKVVDNPQDKTIELSPCPPKDMTQEPSLCHKVEELTPGFERFVGEMNKCILCFSCRQSCYGCYCKTCFMERGEPDWQTASPDIGAKMLYHLGRSTHLSGRCVECGACENACASGVDIRYLIKAVTHFIEVTYDYQAGMDNEPAMLTFKTDDPEIGFLGYEGSDTYV